MQTRNALPEGSVTVSIIGELGLGTWRQLRDAREQAAAAHARLNIDLSRCSDANMGGLGSLLIVKDRLGELFVSGCVKDLADRFEVIGLCDMCHGRNACKRGRHQADRGT